MGGKDQRRLSNEHALNIRLLVGCQVMTGDDRWRQVVGGVYLIISPAVLAWPGHTSARDLAELHQLLSPLSSPLLLHN